MPISTNSVLATYQKKKEFLFEFFKEKAIVGLSEGRWGRNHSNMCWYLSGSVNYAPGQFPDRSLLQEMNIAEIFREVFFDPEVQALLELTK